MWYQGGIKKAHVYIQHMLQTVLFWIMMCDGKFFSGAIHSLLPSDGPTPICHLSSCVRGWSTKHNEEHPAAYWSSTDSAHDHPKESGFILIVTEIFPRGIFHVVYHISLLGFMNVNCWRGKWSHWDELGSKKRCPSDGNSPVPLFPGNGRKRGKLIYWKTQFFQVLTTVITWQYCNITICFEEWICIWLQ